MRSRREIERAIADLRYSAEHGDAYAAGAVDMLAWALGHDRPDELDAAADLTPAPPPWRRTRPPPVPAPRAHTTWPTDLMRRPPRPGR